MTVALIISIVLMQSAPLSKGGGVAGTLRAADGTPAVNVRIGVMVPPEPGRAVNGAGILVSQTETDGNGRFQLNEVSAGRYYIVAGNLNTPTFYPGVRELASARTIEVQPAATVNGIDFEMSAASVAVNLLEIPLAGRIVLKNDPNAPMPRTITFQHHRTRQAVAGQIALVRPIVMSLTFGVEPDGSFKGILPGGEDHRLSNIGLPQGYAFAAMTSGGKNVLDQTIDANRSVDLLVAVEVSDLRTRYRLMANVRDDSSERPLDGLPLELMLASGEVVRMTVNAQGLATFPGLLPGTYRLRLAADGFDVLEKRVVITDGSVQMELRPRKK